MHRHLKEDEILQLKKNNCIAEDWNEIYVKDEFNPEWIFRVSFSGSVKLGNFFKTFDLPGGLKKKSGVRYATLHNVEIGDDCCIENIENYIANYRIGAGSYIKNAGLIYVDGVSSFGNGTKVTVLNETGGREVPIHTKLSSHLAYFVTLYRHRTVFQQRMNEIADYYVNKHSSPIGTIGEGVSIVDVRKIKNVNIYDGADIEGAEYLENGTVNSSKDDIVKIGYNVGCRDFIISQGAVIEDGATLEKCFVGQSCHLTHGYSSTDSLFFSNCFGSNGESCAVFAGPYTVTHHKSTLLIAGMFSFMNAGSGSNQSNHMYKLGPIHQGILERGVKTTSDSYILFPAQIGAFSIVMGRHVNNINSTIFPFSYLIENHNRTYIVPGINLKSVGTIRDAQKWPNRDNRKTSDKLDFINFNLLSPFTIQNMMRGLEALCELSSKGKEDEYTFHGARIKSSALEKGIKYYNIGITKFFGNSIISRLEGHEIPDDETLRQILKPECKVGTGDWGDISGLITPLSEVSRLLDDVENGTINKLKEINERYKTMYDNYYEYEWTWAYSKMFDYFGLNPETVTRKDVIDIVQKWIDAVVSLDRLVYEDARKEFSLSAMTSFGVDGDRTQSIRDFEQVRGTFESNKFVSSVLRHIEKKTLLGSSIIEKLK